MRFLDLAYLTDPMARPGYWNAALELPHVWMENLEAGRTVAEGPHCRIPFCSKRSVDGLLLPEHPAFWIVTWHADSANPRDFRWRWYCRAHLPTRYKQAVLEAMDTVEELLIAKGES